MPATVKSSVGSTGITLADGTWVCPRATKKSTKARRSSSAVVGGLDIGPRLLPGPSQKARFELGLTLPHGRSPFPHCALHVPRPAVDHGGWRVALGNPAHLASDRP